MLNAWKLIPNTKKVKINHIVSCIIVNMEKMIYICKAYSRSSFSFVLYSELHKEIDKAEASKICIHNFFDLIIRLCIHISVNLAVSISLYLLRFTLLNVYFKNFVWIKGISLRGQHHSVFGDLPKVFGSSSYIHRDK